MKKYLYLPKEYILVVGDTFELFYLGIVNAVTVDCYDFEIFYEDGANRGKAWTRKYVFIPTEDDLGEHIMTVRLWNNEGNVLDEQSVRVRIINPPASPQSERVMLFVGASDAEPGYWPAELGRRLVGSDGEPRGLGLENISFIGSLARDGIRYEGYGGWTFQSYTTANIWRNDFMYIYGDFSAKSPSADQHSVYADENGQQWKLEQIESSRIKLICALPWGALPSREGGVLKHISGGDDRSDIIYTSAGNAEANPFWSIEKQRNDFKAYAKRFGKERIDEVVVALTWNSHSWTNEKYREWADAFAKSVNFDFPDCHVTFVGGLFPSREGFSQSYGISWPWFPKLKILREFDGILMSLAEEDPVHRSFVHLSSQHDSENNCQKREYPINARNPQTVLLGCNGLHVAPSGHMQFADAMWRHLCHRLNQTNEKK